MTFRRAAWVAVLVMSTACGRIGFAGIGDDAGDSSDAPTITANIVFATSTLQAPGSLGGIAGADTLCQTRATAANLPGTYLAWISTNTVNAGDRFGAARGWVRPDGQPFVDTLADLLATHFFYQPRLDEFGADVGATPVATATGFNGLLTFANMACADLTDPGAGDIMVGAPDGAAATWTQDVFIQCNTPARLYCLGVDRNVAVSAPEVGSNRRAFNALWPTLGTGIAAADVACQSAASAANLPGTYKALLGTDTATAASRFSSAGPNWVRTDGVALASSPAELLAGMSLTPILLGADGQPYQILIVTGGQPDVAATGTSCVNWTATGVATVAGSSSSSGHDAFDTQSLNCTAMVRVYCLQE